MTNSNIVSNGQQSKHDKCIFITQNDAELQLFFFIWWESSVKTTETDEMV